MTIDDSSSEIDRILEAQEMKGERLVNNIRTGFTALSAVMLAASWDVNTLTSNLIYVAQLGIWAAYAAGLHVFFKLWPERYVWWLKYVSISVDLGLVTLSAWAMAKNHPGIIEYMASFVSLVYMLWNLMSGFRYSLRACLYSAFLSALFNSIVLVAAVWTGAVVVSDVSIYTHTSINISDQIGRIVFIALPAVVAGIIARISRGLVLRAEVESRERARLEREKQQLGRYLSQDLISFVLADPGRLKLGGTRRYVSVMFTDIRNFTPLTESAEPEEVVSFLNEYFSVMVEIVFRYGGTLDKYMGDGLMAVFGAPFQVEFPPRRAVMAALEMVAALKQFNERNGGQFGSIVMGVGIATGTVVSGNIGSPQRMEFTCIGDTVNTAARLEQLNKEIGSQILICQATYAALGDSVPARPAPITVVRGKSREVRPYIIDHEQIQAEDLNQLRQRALSLPLRLDSIPPRPHAASAT